MRRWNLLCSLMLLLNVQSNAQFAPLKTKLKHQTEVEFQTYAQQVEAELLRRWNEKNSFSEMNKVLNGDVVIEAGAQPNPRPITDGLIHDWVGSIYMPNTTLDRVLKVLQDFNHHSAIYPRVVKSQLIKRDREDITGYWRLEQKGQILPAVFDVTQTVHYAKIAPDKWTCKSHADNIRAVENAGARNEKLLPPGEGIGLMWKLYSYWVLQQTGSGVAAECRTLSLSRGVPGGVAWMIKPFVDTVPRESMESTLRNTRKAATE